jgi:Domain of unknown function (DUF6597)
MSFTYEEKQSSSPHVDVVWRAETLTDGVYVASADACWDIIFTHNKEGKAKVRLSGPSSKITNVPYTTGNKNVGVRFKPGVIFTNIPVADMIDVTQVLPMPTEDTFALQDRTWKLPTYEHVDEFISGLVDCGLLSHDPIVRDVVEN